MSPGGFATGFFLPAYEFQRTTDYCKMARNKMPAPKIVAWLSRSPSPIYRELKRNAYLNAELPQYSGQCGDGPGPLRATLQRYRKDGAAAIPHKVRGPPPNNHIHKAERDYALPLIRQSYRNLGQSWRPRCWPNILGSRFHARRCAIEWSRMDSGYRANNAGPSTSHACAGTILGSSFILMGPNISDSGSGRFLHLTHF